MIRRLRVKFICINMLIVTIMLGIIFAMVLHFTNNSMQMEGMRMMQAVGMGRGHGPAPRGSYLTVHMDAAGQITDTDGESFELSEEELYSIVKLAWESKEPFGELSQYDLRFFRRHSPEGEVVILGDTSVERSMLTNLVRDCIIIGAISLLAFFFISLLLSRWAIKPVEQAWTQQRQFVADASHELKTPLTVILTNAELLQAQDYDEAQKKGFAQSIQAMSHQMRGLVESLLELARVDAGSVEMSKTSLDLASVVSEAVLSFEVLFYERSLELQYRSEENILVQGSAAHLRQVTEILLDNAMKYSSPGVTTVTLVKQGHTALLRVSNPGEPIPPGELNKIFKRFYRVDAARSMNHSYGLGLAIAEGIVHEHGGKIKAESENGLNTFTVSIPLIKK